ncbi:DUF1275 family protein [Micrococcus luteus]|uniref:DUF1275 family protein n=1 Tax=Micrococcus luteus TaxID=1270 RepID=UPI002B240373|nr:DUF1275 family protein [Micrococcus luteus]MEB2537046.1 DUF1275 family protein [Micrococcus luteus]
MLNLCAPERTVRRNTHLALVLTAIAGILNSVGFVAVATYTSHMTGIVASMADAAVLHAPGLVGTGLLALALFFLGGVAGAAGHLWLGFEVVIPVAGVLLLIAHRPLIQDLQDAWLTRRPRRR